MVKHIIYKREHIIYKGFDGEWVFISINGNVSWIKTKTIKQYINLIKYDIRYTNIY